MAGGAVLLSNSVLGKVTMASPNERVNIACVGIGNRANEIIKEFHKTGQCNVVALCDVDMGAKQTQEIIKMFPNAPRYQDFRKMFDEMGNQFDAVIVGTPDFAHFAITMQALGMGKHVYVEKPMARTFNEVELMMQKAQKNPKLATQMGNQGHSEANYFQFKAWKDAGIIKNVTRIDAHMNSPRRWHGWDPNITGFPYPERIPETLDWEIWQMQTLGHHYNKDFVNGQWRCWFDFGMGALGDWGAHILDTSHEFLWKPKTWKDITPISSPCLQQLISTSQKERICRRWTSTGMMESITFLKFRKDMAFLDLTRTFLLQAPEKLNQLN